MPQQQARTSPPVSIPQKQWEREREREQQQQQQQQSQIKSPSASDDPPPLLVKRTYNELEARKLVLTNLMKAYRIFPFLCYCDGGKLDYNNPNLVLFESDFRTFIQPIMFLLGIDDEVIRHGAEQLILSFPVLLSNTDTGKAIVAYVGSAVLYDLMSKVMLLMDDSQKKNDLIQYLVKYFGLRVQYRDRDLLKQFVDNPFHESGLCARLVKNPERATFLGSSSNLF
ncbi:unnamed protein product [Ambrosiozyma monospora]|uniref:Unnamed protein product n=1 Tax=Ambrosiozyma monospora TaxID=43982 RepID=A0ACB5U7A4_AMBMO|nr:unnamed protein product [Ambrosiozyma monospora]